MENRKQVPSSSSFTLDLFGPKDSSSSSSSSSTLFGSVFGPSSTGLGRDSSHAGLHGNTKHGIPDYMSQKNKDFMSNGKERNPNIYENERTVEPPSCYLSSSIYYGAQEVYSPTTQSTNHIFKKKEDEHDDPNGSNLNSASRGNWWQGSLYY